MVGDASGDHRNDVLAGAPQSSVTNPGTGYVRLLTAGGLVLETVHGRATGDQFGDSVGGRADINSDGWSALLVGAPFDNSVPRPPGSVRVIDLFHYDDAGKFLTYGAGCPGADGRKPRIGVGRYPHVGQPLDITLTAAPFSKAAALRVGIGRTSLDITSFGMPGCNLLTSLAIMAVDLSATVDASGRASMTFQMPNQSSLIGGQLVFQWWIVEPTVNPRQLINSNGAEITVGKW